MDIQKPLNGINGQVSHESSRGHPSGRGRGQGRGDRGGFVPQRKNRADFSLAGPNHDRSITSVVVEQIPEDKFDEQSVKGFFSDFGPVEEVTMQAYKRLAIVRFSDYPSAKRAYESPKVIFDNRFVKVYWYKPENVPTPTNGSATKAGSPNTADKPEEQPFDKEKFERDSIAAQKKMEEKKTLMKEAEAKRLELEKQKEELAKKQEEEKRKLMEKLKAKEKTGTSGDSATKDKVNAGLNGAQDSKANKQTEVLRATLAALEEEAVSLGIDPATAADPPSYRGRGRGRGRGSYRGWEGFAGRGRGYDPSRGPSRGRASFRGARGGVVYNLDNRTKKVKVSGVNFDSQKDEVLRQHLLVRSDGKGPSDGYANLAIGRRRIRGHRAYRLQQSQSISNHHFQRSLHGGKVHVRVEGFIRNWAAGVLMGEHSSSSGCYGIYQGKRVGNRGHGHGRGEYEW